MSTRGAHLDLFGKGGAEHHGLPDAFVRHCVLLHDASDLWLESHVQHAVGLIQHQEAEHKHSPALRPKPPLVLLALRRRQQPLTKLDGSLSSVHVNSGLGLDWIRESSVCKQMH